jgi:hypothetical protein
VSKQQSGDNNAVIRNLDERKGYSAVDDPPPGARPPRDTGIPVKIQNGAGQPANQNGANLPTNQGAGNAANKDQKG